VKTLATIMFLASAIVANAHEVVDCDWQASLPSIVEPWEENTRVFANGAVRLTLVDVSEPAAGSFHIVALSPPDDGFGGRQCKVVSAFGDVGFSDVEFKELTASYDPSIGLIFDVPVRVFDSGADTFVPKDLTFSLTQATGAIFAVYP